MAGLSWLVGIVIVLVVISADKCLNFFQYTDDTSSQMDGSSHSKRKQKQESSL